MTLKSGLRTLLRPIAEPLATAWLKRNVSYSAYGEDRIVLGWLEAHYRRNVRDIRYLDIGANHPIQLSNTFLFYAMGASGVLVEPDPALARGLIHSRPRDTVLSAGCAFDSRRSAKLKRMTARTFNTFSEDNVERVITASKNWLVSQRQHLVDEIDVPLIPTNDILARHFSDGIDFLSVDVEGVDLAILQSIDLKRFRPTMICVEASADFTSVLDPAGYQRIAVTPDNFVYRHI